MLMEINEIHFRAYRNKQWSNDTAILIFKKNVQKIKFDLK